MIVGFTRHTQREERQFLARGDDLGIRCDLRRERAVQKEPDGVVRVVENFPELGCVFEGVQEDEDKYVPLSMECNLPLPKKRGGNKRPVGEVLNGARADSVPKDETLAKAFFDDRHATTAGFDGNNGAGYFDTAHGIRR